MTLEQLSAAATQGEWISIQSSINPDRHYITNEHHAIFASEIGGTKPADLKFVTSLVNAYRTGQLVAVQPVDRVVVGTVTSPSCMACEGNPAPENNPCAVCGKHMQPDDAMTILLPPASNLSDDYLSGWCEGQAYLIANYGTEKDSNAAIAAMPSQADLQAEIDRLRIELQNIAETTDDDITSRQAFEALSKGPRP